MPAGWGVVLRGRSGLRLYDGPCDTCFPPDEACSNFIWLLLVLGVWGPLCSCSPRGGKYHTWLSSFFLSERRRFKLQNMYVPPVLALPLPSLLGVSCGVRGVCARAVTHTRRAYTIRSPTIKGRRKQRAR